MEDKSLKVEDKSSQLEDKLTKLEDKSSQLEDKLTKVEDKFFSQRYSLKLLKKC
jgi:X-X-X-Leu-X-X-Gly heptad repeat protein